ncbi:type II toxin-antitoxin system RelE/ParE family toxin [Breoghania sp. L-A4]|uniref:type II toxin-antitoxin system RelE/ParE family toxin n=1 Tax=Breoghania sp. L-A4 TaxID=2304600 RepID=UPI000E360178|nr:type II toxin-antitoxin system RelE/ParE family toxin [Breoghania sp. L-A4]AXS39537.1 type II toxin-antitoxin system RelE/ParE family toxin [Breoghania sp. L-A4]
MKQRAVQFAPEARDDLFALYDWIAEAADALTAMVYIERLEGFCQGLDLASERGQARNDIRPGLRIVGFERNATIAFSVDDTHVTILRVFYRGRDWEHAF